MKRVTAFAGSARKGGFTHAATRRFLDDLKKLGDIECEIVSMSDYHIQTCRGCKQCFVKGEEFCPLKDDRDVLIEKMMASDGIVFASPNYSFQVSAIMKIFLDRLGFAFHRPRFFGRTFTSIVVQGIYGGKSIVKYLDLVGGGLGFNTVKGSCVTALEPVTEQEEHKMERALSKHGRRFYERLMKPAYPVPTLFALWAFRMGRTSIKLMLDDRNRDYTYYRDKGWFYSCYYYPVRLGAVKRMAGALFDRFATATAKKRESQSKPAGGEKC